MKDTRQRASATRQPPLAPLTTVFHMPEVAFSAAEREKGAKRLAGGGLRRGVDRNYPPTPWRGNETVVNGANGGQRVVNGWSDRQPPLSGTALKHRCHAVVRPLSRRCPPLSPLSRSLCGMNELTFSLSPFSCVTTRGFASNPPPGPVFTIPSTPGQRGQCVTTRDSGVTTGGQRPHRQRTNRKINGRAIRSRQGIGLIATEEDDQ